jgi:sugar transferase (PEP-CTERM/EpsH1 system associated)
VNLLFLALEPPYPPNDGGRIRTFNILKQMARRHDVTLVAFERAGDGTGDLSELHALCQQVVLLPRPLPAPRSWAVKVRDVPRRYPPCLREYDSPQAWDTLARMVVQGGFDVAHVDQIFLAQYAAALAPLPAVLTHHNVEALAQKRALSVRTDRYSLRWWAAWQDRRRWQRFEVDASRRFAGLATVSEQEAAYFRRRLRKVPVCVVPNGVDVEHFRPAGEPAAEPSLLFTGRMDYAPNVDAVRWFCHDVLPRIRAVQPQATLTIAGRDPAPEVRGLAEMVGVSVTGTVRDVRPYFAESAVYVVPLRWGGGTRLKILEAMAMGLPVVSTALGCEGLDLLPGQDLAVADGAEPFSAAVLQLLQAPAERADLGRRARHTVEQRYDWSTIALQQERAYEAARAAR